VVVDKNYPHATVLHKRDDRAAAHIYDYVLMTNTRERDRMRPEVRWTLGCLIAAAAMVGLLILVLLVAIAFEPPQWIQVMLGAFLALGGALLAWLVAAALGASKEPTAPDAAQPTNIRERQRPE
jgi:protein-S-isoprenylcysteine O-methyltransferase Ste14